MNQKKHRKHPFTLIEISVCLALLLVLTSVFSYLGYDTLQEFRRRNGRAAFKDTLLYLFQENGIKENNLMLLIHQNGDIIETTLGGNTKGLEVKKIPTSFYTGKLFEDNATYAIKITPTALPSDSNLTKWIAQNDCIFEFYTD